MRGSLVSRLAPTALALGLLAPGPLAAAPVATKKPTATKKKPTVGKVAKPRLEKRKKHGKVGRARPSAAAVQSGKALDSVLPKGTALATAALLNYVDGKRKSKTDRRIAKAIDALPGGKATAKRIAKAIRAQPMSVRTKFVGPHGKLMNGPTSTRSIQTVTREAMSLGYAPDLGKLVPVVETLDPEGYDVPNPVDVELAGIVCESAQDADGTDELVVLTKTIPIKGTQTVLTYEHELAAPTVSLSKDEAAAFDLGFPLSRSGGQLVISAVAEDDGDPTASRQDLELAIEIARALALDLGDGVDPIAELVGALAYTENMLALASPDRAPSIEAQLLSSSDLVSWWSADPSETDGVQWKAAVEHELGAGRYTVLFDAPSNPPPKRSVGLIVSRVESTGRPVKAKEHLEVFAEIRNRGTMRRLPNGANGTNPMLHVRRDVLPGLVEIELSATWYAEWRSFDTWVGDEGELHYCGAIPTYEMLEEMKGQDYEYDGPCPQEKIELDVAPGTTKRLTLRYDPSTNRLTHNGKVLREQDGGYVLEGTGGHAGQIKLRVYDQAP